MAHAQEPEAGDAWRYAAVHAQTACGIGCNSCLVWAANRWTALEWTRDELTGGSLRPWDGYSWETKLCSVKGSPLPCAGVDPGDHVRR